MMYLHNNIMTDRKTQPSVSLAGGFGGEKGVENLIANLIRDAAAVIADEDFDFVSAGYQPGVFEYYQ